MIKLLSEIKVGNISENNCFVCHMQSFIKFVSNKICVWYAGMWEQIHWIRELRPDLIILLFLRSFPYTFQQLRGIKIKEKEKHVKNCIKKWNIFRKFVYFFKIIFCFPDFSWLFLMINVQEDPRKKQINWVWPNLTILEICPDRMTKHCPTKVWIVKMSCWLHNTFQKKLKLFRPNSIDLLLLGFFPTSISVSQEGLKNNNKRENRHNLHENANMWEKLSILKTHIFSFPDCF